MTLMQLFLLDRAAEAVLPPSARGQTSVEEQLVAAALTMN